MQATCLLCQPPEVIGSGILEHLLLIHPDVYGDGPDRWPDGGLVIVDQSLEPGHFTNQERTVSDLSMLDGAALIVAGMVLGRFWPARRKHPKLKAPPKPVCGCGHNLAHHEVIPGGAAACHQQIRGKITKWDGYGGPIGWEIGPMLLQAVHTGPTPLPEYFAPEIT